MIKLNQKLWLYIDNDDSLKIVFKAVVTQSQWIFLFKFVHLAYNHDSMHLNHI